MDNPPTDPGGEPESERHWSARKGRAPGLTGITGRMLLSIADRPVGVLHVEDGVAAIVEGSEAECAVAFDNEPILVGLLSGRLHPIVARLRGQAQATGDMALALRIMLGLQARSPWAPDED